MANPLGDFMANWLNSTYNYLKETGGPLRPSPTTGINVMPTGPYTRVEDLPENYYDEPVVSGFPIPFNSPAIGLPASNSGKYDTIEEEAKQDPLPNTISQGYLLLYGATKNACLQDQHHGKMNSNARRACDNFAAYGDLTELILSPDQKSLLGIQTPAPQENDKSDEVKLAENEESLTGQIGTGAGKLWDAVTGFIPSGTPGEGAPGEGADGNTFQDIGNYLKGWIPKLPGVPEINAGTIVMVGGGIILLVLVISIIK